MPGDFYFVVLDLCEQVRATATQEECSPILFVRSE
ncbi:hypothetical protein [Coxiella burnetii]|uniref:Uncharacterized protein n=1 Tax=Coxiella burnetii (strain RSA 493 / Nine Mile phase I) TaxID=227377 RepID=Q83EF4_COXBU|nr:hypothetical protein [Coxiella burnetii]NP_819409.1 hypothetical protein CBU_0369 [Coxiella burnetii RSA 493]AAO89923.1 hypothetical protein CBU_0369 [Coxiella burnetii RSA 493]ACJ18923.1 hypothetical protein CbuG_1640 [Coxiella burnetii CbuG_Q212]ACJ19835.1 hypothetical protein CbuK_0560 [Coxiella burnetii CbuK_Q154]ARI65254.1 hypothetical protein B7L74_01900 [Coxiella burnetii]ATN72483.1 hypothetical protein AYM11_04755 [Coxiella burnetii]